MNKIKMEVISIVKWEDKEVPVAELLKELFEQNAKQKNSIDKAIELIENDYFEDGSGEYIEQVLSILRGEDNE